MIGADLYLAGYSFDIGKDAYYRINAEPCKICRRMLKNAGIKRYYNQAGWHDI